MEYIAERVVNISMLASYIEQANIRAQLILGELKEDSPSMERLSRLSTEMVKYINDANKFEFHIERRKESY